MHTRKEVHWRKKKLLSEQPHPVTGPLGENSRNPAKEQEKSMLKPNEVQ